MLDMTSFDAALKEHYTDDRVENMTYMDNPLYALIPKMEAFGGRNLPVPIIYGDPQGRSKTFTNAQVRGLATSALVDSYVLTRNHDYSIGTIDNETLEASKGDPNAFMEAATTEIDGAIHALVRSIAINMYRTKAAYYAQVLAEPTETSTTFNITVADPDDITNFEVGQMLVIWSAATGGTQRTSDGADDEWSVAAVNRSTGVITLNGDYTSSGTIAANDYIFVEGDRGLGYSGLEDWLPSTTPGATAFFGVDRSVDPTRLGGLRLNAASLPIEEALIEGDALVAREGWPMDHFFMNHDTFGDLKKALGTKVQYVDLKANADISFRGVMVDGTRGPIKVIPDQNCPGNRIFGLRLSFWKLYTLGKSVRVIEADGLQMLRLAAADGVEVRYGFYGQLGCRGPGANINIQI